MRKKITRNLKTGFLMLTMVCMTLIAEAQWTGLNPLLTGSDVGIGHISLGGMSSVITAPDGHLHVSRIEPSIMFPGTIVKPQIIVQSWCEGIGEPGSPFGASQSAFSLETNCYANSLSLNDYNSNKQLWSFSSNNTFSSVQNLNIANNFMLSNSDLILNVPIKGFTSTGTAHFNARANFNSHAYFYNKTYFHNEIQLKNNSSILFEDNNSSVQLGLFGNGYIRAREIKVDLQPIPDYVFKPGYKLMSLSELEKYIATHNHLPNIKGENEFDEAEGISLGDMNMKLLEKVEELTLYTIQQQKELEELKKLVSAFVKK